MGLFESKAEKNARIAAAQRAREEQKERFEKSEVIKFIINSILTEENEWLIVRQSYYDCGERIVYVFPDRFSIDWREAKKVQIQAEQGVREEWDYDTMKSFEFAYTSCGYVPVNNDVLETWTEIIQKQLKSVLPNCAFNSITSAVGRTIRNERCSGYRFTYTLPEIHLKSWY